MPGADIMTVKGAIIALLPRLLLLLSLTATVAMPDSLSFPVKVPAPAPTGAASAYFKEYEIKAGFIYKFMSFVSWPEGLPDNGMITIAILGPNPFGDAFNAIEGSTVGNRVVQVKYFSNETSYEELKTCQVLFISSLPDQKLKDLLAAIADAPVLTIGDSKGFIDNGGMIGFLRNEKKQVAIEINITAASRARLTIRSMLKRISTRIIVGVKRTHNRQRGIKDEAHLPMGQAQYTIPEAMLLQHIQESTTHDNN
jgi:hypothetical protein